MLIEFWLNPFTDGFVARLTKPNENKFELLSEVNFNNCLGSIAWHHVAINVNSIKKGDKYIEVYYVCYYILKLILKCILCYLGNSINRWT